MAAPQNATLPGAGSKARLASASVHNLPAEERFYRDVLLLAGGASGDGSAPATASVLLPDPLLGSTSRPLPTDSGAARRLTVSAIRVLADLAEDGRLTPSEGKPALAALLGAQTPSGAIAEDTRTQALAAWALAEAAEAAPRDPWVRSAADKAVADLVQRTIASSNGSPARPLDAEGARWARLVLGWLRPAKALRIEAPSGDPSKPYSELTLAVSAAGVTARTSPGRTPWERLLHSVRLGHLKLVR